MFLEIEHVKIYYEALGEGTPVFLLHGFGCDHRLMTGCLEPVFQSHPGYRRIYPDLPGMGASDAPMDKSSSDELLQLLISLIDQLAEGPFLLAGESYGGYLAQGILSSLAPRVDGLLLICPVVDPENLDRGLSKSARDYDNRFLSTLSPQDRESFCRYAVIANETTYQRYRQEVASGQNVANPRFLEELSRRYALAFDGEEPRSRQKFEKPALFLAGRQDVCVGYRDLLPLLDSFPRATLSVLDMAGHCLQIERPALFNSLVGDWLCRVAQSKQ